MIAHRGASGYLPEHTATAYRLAVGIGADAVEPDIVPTRDGVLLVRHENELGSTTDIADRPDFAARHTSKIVDGQRVTGWFSEDFDWDEIQTLRCRERIPELRPANTEFDGAEPPLRLSQLLRLIDEFDAELSRRALAVIEIKHAHYFASLGFNLPELLRRELADAGWLNRTEQLVFESFELGVLLQLAGTGVHGDLVMLNEHAGKPADAGQRIRVGDARVRMPRHSYRWYRSRAGLRFLREHVSAISVEKCDLFAGGCSCRTPLALFAGQAGRASGRCGLARRTLGRLRARLARGAKLSRLVRRANARGLDVFVWTARPESAFLEPRYRYGRITRGGCRWLPGGFLGGLFGWAVGVVRRLLTGLLLKNPISLLIYGLALRVIRRRAAKLLQHNRPRLRRSWIVRVWQKRLRSHGDWVGEYRAICKSGVAAVFADHPDLFKAVRDGDI